ncbi:IS4 family transposase [Virgibacillus dokdonensis]|uniref:Transposase DDE domain protein n=1 Tax=Virgibacillus dokdonensis TaxID=302167 RepID=A0A2K9J5I8_9BACI|nr:IS4 family transposase [Virgibacillus dokdonensis]AUJ24850.1 Transposase DDE domain protein [Virgibacillus dokdonensis]AUJ27004.1 Transposase DDE domain protein [Virgibacillus dokdonensis]
MDNYTIKTVFKEYIHPLDSKIIQTMTAITGLDKYVKKLDTLTFINLFIYAQLKKRSSLKEISNALSRKKAVQRLVGIDSISKSQLSRKNREIPHETLDVILRHLIQKIHLVLGPVKAEKVLNKLNLIDSSTISMCLSGYEWAVFRETKSGIKIHTSVLLCEEDVYPNKIIPTPARPADETKLDALIMPDEDVLNVFDRGYFNFKKFDAYSAEGIKFATRLKTNTLVHVIEDLPVEDASPITRHAIVKIGNMKNYLQLVETSDSEGNKIRIVCNDASRSAAEISDIYRNRWKIELFFKWIKQHLVIKKLYGKSENAVYNQIYLAMITFCLTLLIKHKLGFKGTLLEMLDWIRDCYDNKMSTFVLEIFKEPERSSSGQRRQKHRRIFEETLAQYELGDVLHLDDLTYDPII